MIKLLPLSILWLIIPTLILQGQEIELVDKKLDSIKEISSKIDFLNDWTGNNYRKFPEEALFYSKKTLQLATKIKNHSGAADAFVRIGLVYKLRGEHFEVLKFYNQALDKYKVSFDSLGINKIYLNRGNLYRIMDKNELAIEDLFKCLRYFEKQKDDHYTALTYNNIGIVFKNLKYYEKALEYYKKAAFIFNKTNAKSSLYLSNTNIANILSIQNKSQEALVYYKKNLAVLKENPNKYRSAQTYHNIGSCFLEMGKYPFALEYLKQSLQLKEEIGNKSLIISTINSIAHIFYLQSNFEQALKYRKKALALAIETKNIVYQKNCYKEIFQILSYLNQPDSSISYFVRYEHLKDSIFSHEKLKQIAEIQEKYESEKKEAHIVLLKKENKNKMMQRNGLLIILVLLLAYALFIVRSYYKNKRTNRLLRLQKTRIEWHKTILDRKNEALRDSNQTKNRLFQIISHDLRSPLASVSGISKLIKIFVLQKKYDLLEESSEDMEQCISSVLNLTDNLLSWSLNQSGRLPYNPVVISLKMILSNNIKTYQTAAKQKNIYMELIVDNDVFVFADRQMLDTVIRNLINNSLKFTPAGGVIVLGSKRKGDFIEIWVKDSGVGIPEDQIPYIFEIHNSKSHLGTRGEKGSGLGLILCKQFIEQNRGEIWAESIKNVGSTFRFTVPNAENTAEIESALTSNSQ